MNPQDENLRAVIYCRVSTKEQVTDGMSLKTQENICMDYALKNGYEIEQIFIEQGESAKTADRTELKKLLSYCTDKKNRVHAVIAYKIDRISRNTDDYSQIRLLLKRYNVEIKSTSEYFDNNPAGRFMENIIANVAQFDNDVRTERSVNGMKEAMNEGRYVWRAPLGYSNTRINGKANIAPNDDAPKVIKVFNYVANGNYISTEAVRHAVNKEGLLQYNGKPISRSYFYTLLRNKVYMGVIHKFGEVRKGNFEPLVDEVLFQQVQRILKNKGKTTSFYKRDNSDFPLRRFVLNLSGQKLTGSWSRGRLGGRYAFYRFKEKMSNYRKDVLEAEFISFMNTFAFDRAFYAKFRRYLKEDLQSTGADKAKKKEELNSRIASLGEQEAGLLIRHEKGLINDEMLKRQSQRLSAEIHKVQEAIMSLNDQNEDIEELLEFAEEFLLYPGKTWQKAGLESKMCLQGFQFPLGVIFDGKKFKTPETAFIFKVKEEIIAALSSKVHLRCGFENPLINDLVQIQKILKHK